LSSGVARGLAHIEVLGVLEKRGIPIDMVAGTSIGALVGAVYAQGIAVDEMKRLAVELGPKRFSWLLDPALPKTGLVRGRKIEEILKSIIGDREFNDLERPFACVATDIDGCEEVVFREGPVWPAVRASISLPVILAVTQWAGRYLVDGALVNPAPVSVLKAMGAEFIIAVNVVPANIIREVKEPNILSVMLQTLHIISCQMMKSSLIGADIVIEPRVEDIASTDFHRAGECIELGELAAQAAIKKIKRRLQSRVAKNLAAQ